MVSEKYHHDGQQHASSVPSPVVLVVSAPAIAPAVPLVYLKHSADTCLYILGKAQYRAPASK